MIDGLRNPTPGTLGLVTILVVIPLFWPITLYVWLRYLTGHKKSPRKDGTELW